MACSPSTSKYAPVLNPVSPELTLILLYMLLSWRVDCTWPAQMAQWRTRRSSACRVMCGERLTTMVVGRVLARSRSRPCCRMCSWITDRDARSLPRTIIRPPMLRISGCNAAISSGSLSSARGASWHFGSSRKSEWAFRVAPGLTRRSRCLSDSRLT
jgi:hypothetical protein